METIHALLSAGNFQDLAAELESREFELANFDAIHGALSQPPDGSLAPQHAGPTHSFPPPQLPEVPAPLVFSLLLSTYLVLDDLNSARFLAKRVPRQYSSHALFAAVEPLYISLWNKDLASFWAVVGATQAQIEGDPDSALVANTVGSLVYAVRVRTKVLLRRAYAVARVSEAAEMLGLTRHETTESLGLEGWKLEGEFLVAPESEKEGKEGAKANGKAAAELAYQRDRALNRLKMVAADVLQLEL